jgi:hypothetical protein
MKYAVEMGSGTVFVSTKLHEDVFRPSNVSCEDSQTHRQHGDRISLV